MRRRRRRLLTLAKVRKTEDFTGKDEKFNKTSGLLV